MTASTTVTPHVVLEDDLAADYLERRGEVREEHLALLGTRDDLVLAGALDTAERALLVLRREDVAAVEGPSPGSTRTSCRAWSRPGGSCAGTSSRATPSDRPGRRAGREREAGPTPPRPVDLGPST